MKSLIEDILSLESQANQLVEDARAKAKGLDKEADAEIRRIQEQVAASVEQRTAAFRADAERKTQDELARAQAEHAQALAGLDRISDAAVQQHAQRVVARFRGI